MKRFLWAGRALPYWRGLATYLKRIKTLLSMGLSGVLLRAEPLQGLFRRRGIYRPLGLLFVCSVILQSCLVSAQESRDGGATGSFQTEIKPLQIGDTIPEEFWTRRFQQIKGDANKVSLVNLEAYRDKLLILDFWSTWCGSCLEGMTKITNELNALKSDQVHLLCVTSQNQEAIRSSGVAIKNIYQNDISSIIADTLLRKYFYHRTIPHVVWIKDNKIIGQTSTSYVVTEKINQALSGQTKKWPVKEFKRNNLKPFLQGKEFSSARMAGFKDAFGVYYTSILKDSSDFFSVRLFNHSPLDLMLKSLGKFPMNLTNYIINESSVPLGVLFFNKYGDSIMDDWYAENALSFESYGGSKSDSWKSLAYDMVAGKFNIMVSITDTLVNCYILEAIISTTELDKEIDAIEFNSVGQAISYLNQQEGSNPVLNRIGSNSRNLKIFLPKHMPLDYLQLNDYLMPQGFRLRTAKEIVEMIVIKDGGHHAI